MISRKELRKQRKERNEKRQKKKEKKSYLYEDDMALEVQEDLMDRIKKNMYRLKEKQSLFSDQKRQH